MARDLSDPKIPWSGRGSKYTEQEIAYIIEAMTEADPLTQGRYQRRFEDGFKDFTGAAHAFATSSCTTALELAAMLSGVGPGDEVIIPAHTFAATAIPFGRTGATLVWADIDPDTLTVDPASIERLISERTKVVVPVHLYGLMADMDPILTIAEANRLTVVEDAAQALGATYKGHQAGTMGHFGCFSFHTHKSMTTLGEGGMLTVKDADTAAKVPGLRHNGMRGYPADMERPNYWSPAMSDVDSDVEGLWPINACLGEVACAAGVVQLKRLPEMNATRRRRAEEMMEALAGYTELAFQHTPAECENVHYCLPARFTGPAGRDRFMERMAFHHKIKMVVQYRPLHQYPLFAKAGFGTAQVPESEAFFDAMVSFPFHHWMPEEQFEAMIQATRETLDTLRMEGA